MNRNKLLNHSKLQASTDNTLRSQFLMQAKIWNDIADNNDTVYEPCVSNVSQIHSSFCSSVCQKLNHPANNTRNKVEQLVEQLKLVEEGFFYHLHFQFFKNKEADLINMDATVHNLVIIEENGQSTSTFQVTKPKCYMSSCDISKTSDCNNENMHLLPRRAIVYDYTTQPVIVLEEQRKFLHNLNTISTPFLRPIIIDGVGLVKAFPLMPIIRCLFYWISKGHLTVLCFPSMFNAIDHDSFNATVPQKQIIRTLMCFKLCTIFNTTCEEDNKAWYDNILKNYRVCLITTVYQWHLAMPNNLESGVMTTCADGFSNYCYSYKSNFEKCPERLLQPFFSHEGKLVFFSSFSAAGACVADMILESAVFSLEDFKFFDEIQLSFIEQAKMLKVLYSFLPANSRFRETSVMVKILERLKPFLP